jgi:myo-inositol-1(or 4)-monophosphatase
VRDEMFWAEKGTGAFNNHQRLRVSGRRKMEDAVIATGMPFKGRGNHAEYLPQIEAIMALTAGVRRFGAASLDLAYVAAGRFDGFWESSLQPWDVAAGILLVTEAGGFVSEIGGGRNPWSGDSVIAANDHLHLTLAKTLRGVAAKNKPKAAD